MLLGYIWLLGIFVTVFRKTNRSARKSFIAYTRKYAFEHEDANVNKGKEACFTHRRMLDWLQIWTAASSLHVKGNKAIKNLANRLVFPNTVTFVNNSCDIQYIKINVKNSSKLL